MAAPRLAVLVSGSGTILEAILAAGLQVDVVVADRPCRGLDIAKAAGIPAAFVNRADFGGFTKSFDREAYSAALVETLRHHEVSLIAMAGFGDANCCGRSCLLLLSALRRRFNSLRFVACTNVVPVLDLREKPIR